MKTDDARAQWYTYAHTGTLTHNNKRRDFVLWATELHLIASALGNG